MKPHTFFTKYANLPIPDRSMQQMIMTSEGYQSYSPADCYGEINKWQEKASEADRELKKWLIIAEKVLH